MIAILAATAAIEITLFVFGVRGAWRKHRHRAAHRLWRITQS